MKSLKKIVKKIITYFIILVTKIDDNKVVCINFNGNGYGDNPKYIANELIKNNFCVIWLVNDINSPMPKEIKKVKYRSINAIYELETAKVVITNVTSGSKLIKRKGQFLIQTWHASYSMKFLEKAAEEKLTKEYVKESKYNCEHTDLFLSNSRMQTNEYHNSFWGNGKVFESGYPRNDIFFNITQTEVNNIKKNLGISKNKKIIFYTPTFRDNQSKEGYKLDCHKILEKLKGEYIFLVRMHPNVVDYSEIFRFDDEVLDVTHYDDVQQLLAIADILITDYSTTMFDFLLLKNPVFLFALDLEEYQKMRGLKETYFRLPFDLCKTNDELIKAMISFDHNKYDKKIQKFLKKYLAFDDGKATERVVEEIKKMCNNTFKDNNFD